MLRLHRTLADTVQSLGRPLVHVVGDLMLDVYAIGTATRISAEAPIPVLRWEDHEYRAGGAANVAVMLAALGAQVRVAGVIGDDHEGCALRQILETAGVDVAGVVTDDQRCTTAKHRFVGRAAQRQPHQLLRMDREVVRPLSARQRQALLDGLRHEPLPGALLISDYDKGVCQQGVAEALISWGREHGVAALVDPAPHGELDRYATAHVVAPNRREAERAAGQAITSPAQALVIGQAFCRRHQLDAVVIKLDQEGAVLAYPYVEGRVEPTRAQQVCDVTGAGDMILAVLGLCRAASVPLDRALTLANVAAGLEVERFGTAVITRGELLQTLLTTRSSADKVVCRQILLEQVTQRRASGQRIALTNGCFDLLHPGHVATLEQGAPLADCLVVAINSDNSVRRLKGPARPVLSQADRAAMVAALGCVDLVTLFDESDPCALIELLRPDVLFKGGDYPQEGVVGREIVEEHGGRVYALPALVDASSTGLIRHIREMTLQPQRSGVPESDAPPAGAKEIA